jgi:aminopeptidase N
MKTVTRLFESFQPEHYDIKLTFEREARHFSGLVSIIGKTLHEANELTLHASGLIINSATINGKTAAISYREDELTLSVSEKLDISEHTIELAFDGAITDTLHGLYPCYFEHDGIKEELLVTQFESHHAREVFPCIDEPEAKATFQLTLNTESGVTVLGNMPTEQQSEHDNHQIIRFAESPKMSTYLLAFVVGKLQHKEAYTKDGVLVRSFATHNQPAESLDFSLDTAIKVIEKFNEYFGIPYPLPKSDHVALPDFSSGAMENWGLITYREICLLVDPKNTSIASREYVATVIAHELSHQWFGNLVTMKWWDDLWLNESFATLMEYLVIDQLFPEWNIWMTFATTETLSAQRRDCLPGVQAVRTPVSHPDQISTLFDSSIVYAKGAKLLYMLYHYIGDTAFQAGLRIYFKKHAYGNTVGDDLWLALGEAAHKDLREFMHAWLDKPGYPVVTVTQNDASLRLSQHRFLSIQPETADTSLWPIPLGTRPALPNPVFDTTEQTITLMSPNWVKLNTVDQSFFISRYTNPAHRAALREQIASKELGILDRLQLLNEALLLARGNEASITEALELLTAYTEETSDPIWDIIGAVIRDARMLLETDLETTEVLKTFVRKLVMPMYDKLGWDKKENEPDEITKLRVGVLGLAVWSEHKPALKEALQRFNTFSTPNDIPAELRTLTYSVGARWLGEAAFNKLITLHDAINSSEERNNLAAGMTSTTDPVVITKILALLTEGTKIRLQDIDRWHIYLMRNRSARKEAWEWLTNNWDFIEANFGSDKSYDNFVRFSAGSLQGKTWLDKFDTFFNNKLDQPAITRVIEIGHSDIVARTNWVERDLPILRQYLAATP